MNELIPIDVIAEKICYIRNQKVMLDKDLAWLYGVETKVLKQAVKRNIRRFPDDFMFELTQTEFERLRSQFVTSNIGRGGARYRPYAFTEQGIAMLSGVLNTERAIDVNIQIMRTFTRLRQMINVTDDLKRDLDALKDLTDQRFHIVFETLDQILATEVRDKKKIGFTLKEAQAEYVPQGTGG